MRESQSLPATIETWLVEPMTPDVRKAIDRLARAPSVTRIAVMPDVHLAPGACVGTVAATRSALYPGAVGGDIGCGIATIALGGDLPRHRPTLEAVLADLRGAVPIKRHASVDHAPVLPPDIGTLRDPCCAGDIARTGRVELGTLGRGNHFLELQVDADERAWLMVHSGSRSMGQRIRAAHEAGATRTFATLRMLDAESREGQSYLHDAAWAVRYARANRHAMLTSAAQVIHDRLGLIADWSTLVDVHHNHVREEEHFGERLYIHRKGAAPASHGAPGLIPGHMGGESLHVVGRGEPESLRSSSHGAGRRLARSDARRKVDKRELERLHASCVFDARPAHALREEAPSAYKPLDAVMRAQRRLVKTARRVRAVLCYKGI